MITFSESSIVRLSIVCCQSSTISLLIYSRGHSFEPVLMNLVQNVCHCKIWVRTGSLGVKN